MRGLLGGLILGFALYALPAFSQQPVPALTGFVTDLTGTLTSDQQSKLAQRLAQFETEKGSQLYVLIVPTTAPEGIAPYALRVAEAWKAGRAKIDDGLLLIVAKDDRKVRIEVGYGLEGAVPDASAKRIINEVITPQFRQGNFFAGVEGALDRLIGLVAGEPLPEPEGNSKQPESDGFAMLFPVLFLLFPLTPWLSRTIGRLPAALVAAGVLGGLGYFAAGLIVGFFLAFFGFIVTIKSRAGLNGGPVGPRRRGQDGIFAGAGGGGSGRSGGGGFRGGGGGGFGGGGASGSW